MTTAEAAREIEHLLYEYAERIDAGDFAGLGRLLAEAEVGAIGQPGGLRGEAAVTELFTRTTRRYDDGTPRTKHVTTNVRVEADEAAGTASARSYFTVFQAVPGLALQPIVAGRYQDRFARRHGRWWFTERRFAVDLVGDVSRHLADPTAAGPGAGGDPNGGGRPG